RYEEARAQFQQALDRARSFGNESQQVLILIELGNLAHVEGKTAESQEIARQVIDFAQQRHLENLTIGGLIELGNSCNSKGDYAGAEKYYTQALEFARANKARRLEAAAKSNLGGLYIQSLRVDEGLPLVQDALSFFEKGNYRGDVSACLTQLGRAYRRRGEYEEAAKALQRKLD